MYEPEGHILCVVGSYRALDNSIRKRRLKSIHATLQSLTVQVKRH